METAKITFINGTSIEVEANGNCFIVDEKPTFPSDLSEVTVEYETIIPPEPEPEDEEIPDVENGEILDFEDEGTSEEETPVEPEPIIETAIFHNVEVIECASVDGRYWFSFREMSELELKEITNEAQIFYTAMMTDTLLEE